MRASAALKGLGARFWPPPPALVPVGAGACLAFVAVTATFVALNHASIHGIDGANPIELVTPLTFALVGGVVARRRPENPIGWLFLFMGVVMGLSGTASQYARYAAITHPGALPGASWALWVYNWTPPLVYPAGAAALTFLLLPDGRLPSRRWRAVVVTAVCFTAALIALSALVPGTNTGAGNSPQLANPAGLAALAGVGNSPFQTVAWLAGLAILLVAAAAPIVRMRRSQGEEREQLKWIAYTIVVSVIIDAVVNAGYFVFQQSPVFQGNTIFDAVIVLGYGIALPAATGVAILKYHLYDIDVVISRTLVYGSLAVLITGVYVGIAVGIGELVGSGGKPNLGLSILATAIVAVGFQPARERLQRVANGLVYGNRATPYQVLSEFSSQVASSYAADEVLPRMARVLQEGTGAEAAVVWLRSGAALQAAARWPHDAGADGEAQTSVAFDGSETPLPGATRTVEVRHQGEPLGALSVTKRRGETLTPVEEKLLSDLAHQAGLVLKNVGLTADLQRRLEELRASRQRLVSAQDEERRRLERNLHDGAQQHLVALKVKLGLAEMLTAKDPEKAKATLAQLKSDADEALQTLRDLARGIYPQLLAEKGLALALESQARKATLPVTVDADGAGRYRQEVEATVYFCVLEALQNVQKYAGASAVTIRLREAEAILSFEVADDGRGFDTEHMRKGSGLTNMQDRLDALDGVLRLESTAGRTCVIGQLPLHAPVPVR